MRSPWCQAMTSPHAADELRSLFGEQGPSSPTALPAPAAAARTPSTSSPTRRRDELLFITIHQVYRLWFQQLLHVKLTSARDAMLRGVDGSRLWWAQHLLARAHVVEQVLVQQIDVLRRR